MIQTTRGGREQFFYTLYSVIAIGGFPMESKKDIIDILQLFDFSINKKTEESVNRYLKNRKKVTKRT